MSAAAEGPPHGSSPATPPGIRDGARYSEELEALRGVAILLVFLYHADTALREQRGELIGTAVPLLNAFVHSGFSGVTLFFVLSAFLLSRPFLAAARGGPRVNLGRYFARRALRIMPLYAVAVAAGTLLTASRPADLLHGLPYLAFLNSIGGMAEPLAPYSAVWWSLATEAQFYLVLPLVALSFAPGPGRWIGGVLLLAYAVAYGAFAAHAFKMSTVAGQLALALSVFGRFSAFAAGIAGAWVHDRHGPRIRAALRDRPWVRNGGADVLLVLTLVALGSLLQEVTARGFWRAEAHWHAWHVPEALLWGLVVLLLLLAPLRSRFLLSNRPLRWLGLLSYSIYLLHYPILFFVLEPLRQAHPESFDGWTLASLAMVGVCLLLCTALSALTYRTIERPFLVRKARVRG